MVIAAPPGVRSLLSCMLACCAGVVVITSGCDSDIYPLGNVILTGPSGTASHVVDDNHTFAFPRRDLQPPSADPPGTTHTLTFMSPSGLTPRQEIIGFDLDYSEPIVDGPQPAIDYVPALVRYVSVAAGSSKTYTFDQAPTSHVIRYWHGSCAAATPWIDLFDPISAQLFEGLADGADAGGASSIERIYDVFQPYFIGAYATIEHGFSFEALYKLHGFGLPFSYYMNPAYEFRVRPEDGLVDLESVHQDVVPGSPEIEDALAVTLPGEVARTINERLTFSLENPVIATVCDPTASTSTQQEFCFTKAVGSPSDPGYLGFIFQLGLEKSGMDESVAQWLAAEMVAGLVPKNFACIASADGGGTCAFHPDILRINVMPDELELVLVAEDDPSEKYLLYANLPAVVAGLLPGTEVPHLCSVPIARAGGEVFMATHGYDYRDL
ncbi:MAG: hypothetical protein IT372_18605 [Polyangiaceae bacterium]|nr:hypothetical protein [Polyangiaceae bacterium]